MKRYLPIIMIWLLGAICVQAQTYVLSWSNTQTIEQGAKYIISASPAPPAANWYAEDYDASAWTAMTQRYYAYNTATPYCWQRRCFTLAAAPAQKYMLQYSLDDEGCIYVNGHKVVEVSNCPTDSINITTYLHAGTNVVAGYVYDSGSGATYLHMGVYISPTFQYSGICGRKINQNTDSTNLRWHLDTFDGVLHITGSGAMRDYSTDTKAPWYPYRAQISRIDISDDVTCIGNYAFYQCASFDSIYVGNAVARLGSYSFNGASNMRTLFLSSVRNIQSYACYGCTRLSHVDFNNSVSTVATRAFYNCSNLGKVTNTENMESIGSYCFSGCTLLNSILFHEGFKTIDTYAFQSCQNLHALRFPSTLTAVSGNSFRDCPALDTIEVASGNSKYDSRANCNAVMLTSSNSLIVGCVNTNIPGNTISIGEYAFSGCRRRTAIEFPDGMQSIGSYSFENCSQLSTVSVPNSVNSSGSYCFSGCGALTAPVKNDHLFIWMLRSHVGSYDIPEGITVVSNTAFQGCQRITAVSVPEGVTSLLTRAFESCSALDTIVLPTSLRAISSYCFYNSSALRSIHIHDGISSIPNRAFYGCRSLKHVRLPETLKTIDTYAFNGCSGLLSVSIPDATTTIGSNAFNGCSSLSSVSIPSAITSIGENSFSGCSALRQIIWNAKAAASYTSASATPFYAVRNGILQVIFGDSVEIVPKYLCYGMKQLTSISIGRNVREVLPFAFEECWGIKNVTWNAEHCQDFEVYDYAPVYMVRDSIQSFVFGNNVRYIPAYLCMGMKRIRSLRIPASVEQIGEYAFREVSQLDTIIVEAGNMKYDSRNNCNALILTRGNKLILGCKNTVIPQDINTIEPCAFRDCWGLNSAVIPDCVQAIGREAFYGCKDLVTITLPSGLKRVEDYTFTDCRSLKNVLWSDSLQYIGVRGFGHCDSLTSMVLPSTISRLDQMAITNCPNLRAMWCLADTVPQIEYNSMDLGCPIYVPCGSLHDYRVDAYWQQYSLFGIYDFRFSAEANDNFFGRVDILQQPDCENNAHVLATAANNYEFKRWINKHTQQIVSTEADLTLRVNNDLAIVGIFGAVGDNPGDTTIVSPPDAIDDIPLECSITIEGYDIVCKSNEFMMIRVIDINGGVIATTSTDATGSARISVPSSGIYIVNTTKGTTKVFIK